jgi:polar amino acid transport system permease protein
MGIGACCMTSLPWDWDFAWRILPDLLAGLRVTVVATMMGSLLAFGFGMVWTLIRMMQVPLLTRVVAFLVEFVRGTPLLIQLYCLFHVFPSWGLSLPPMTTGIFGLGLFYSAYAAEIYRAGIEDLPSGQWEAALTLGLPLRRVWLGIVLPQSIRTVLPMLGNQVVAMFKETSLLSTITVMELLAQATNIGSIEFRYVEPLTLAGVCYFIISYSAARGLRRFEKTHAAAT